MGEDEFFCSRNQHQWQKSLHFAYEVKVYCKVNQFKPEDDKKVGVLFNQFLRMEFVSENERKAAYEQLVGPFRIIQYLLNAVYQDNNPQPFKVE
jgi:hypothetical protein